MELQMNKLMKYSIVVAVTMIVLSIFGCATLTRIDVGHIGVKIKLAGSDRGVQDMQLKTGWVFYNPLSDQIVEFPVSVQNIILSASKTEGASDKDKEGKDHSVDESITFSSMEGVNANADIGFSFHIDPQQAPHLYARFRQNDMRELAYGYMRNVLRESFSEVASKMPIQEIYGSGKSKMIAEVTKKCQDNLGKDGIIIDQLTINGALRLPPNVADAINNAMAATQNAVQSENKVRQVKAEAEQTVAASMGAAEAARQKAKGEADALITRTNAEAETRITQAESQAKANKIINSSLTPQVIQFKYVDTWNGALPTYVGGGVNPMLNIGK
jgi:regulator of protease activity HflC (stomatin/prohibitin superfamily)